MVDNVTMPGTEGIVASSQQQKVALEPATFYNDPLSERIAAVEPSTIKEAKEKKLRDDIAWKEYLSNPARMTDAVRIKEDYRKYRQIESMWRKPEYASIIDEYGSDMAVGGQMLADYVDWDKVPWWDKQVIGIRSARYGMKIGEARTKVAQLEHDGADQTQIDEAKAELARLEKYTAENSRPYESDTANAFASFGVSAARVIPEMLATSAAIALTAKTAGAAAPAAGLAATRLSMALGSMFGKAGRAANIVRGLKTARALERGSKYTTMAGKLTKELASGGAQAGIIYGDTYRVTMGDLYQKIKDENPGISDERAYEMADTSATIQSAMESAPAFIGLGARAAITTELDTIVKSVLTKTPTDQIRRAAFIKYFQEEFNSGLGKRIAKGWLGDTLVDTVTEVAQQASENATLKLAAEGGEGNVTAETFGRIGGFLLDPLNAEYDDELNTLLSVAPAAAVFGGVAPGIAYAANKASKSSVGSKITDAFRSNRFGEQLRNYTQEMTDKVGAEVLKEQLRGMASRGDAPGTVRFDAAAIQELVDTDPELRVAMDKLGVLRKLEESKGNGGVIEVPIEEYNEVVNGEKSGVLYQKVKDMVSFRLDAMTMTELNEWIASTEAQNKKEIQEAIANERSVYNRMLNEYFSNPIFDRMTEGQKKANAALAQLMANRATRSLLSPMTAEEWYEKNVMFVTGEREGFGTTTTPTPTEQTPSLFDLRNTTQTNLQLFGGTQSFVQTQAFEAAKNNPALIPAGEEGGVAYDAQDFSRAVGDEIDALRSEDSYPRGRPKPFFEPGSPIREAAKKWLTEDPAAKAYYEKAQQQAKDFESALADERNAEAKTAEEKATQQITTSSSATIGAPEDIIFDIKDRDSNFEKNFKKNGEIKETTKKNINSLFPTRVLAETEGTMSELYNLIGNKNAKWIANDVKSTDIVAFANKHDVSPNLIYLAVNIARGKPEARVQVVMPSDKLSKEGRDNILTYFMDKYNTYSRTGDDGSEVKRLLEALSDYELHMLYELDPDYLSLNYDKEKLIARYNGVGSDYVDKKSLEKRYASRFGGVYFSFGKSTRGHWYLWGNMGDSNKTTGVMDFASQEEMEKYRDEHSVSEITKEVIDTLTGRAEERLRALNEGIKREGKDYRNGKDVSIEDIQNRFGFRTVGWFGVTSSQGQKFLNSLYDAFSTMADMLGIPYSAMSLSGTLGVTTNSGRHRTSSAWYDPSSHNIDFVVTKDLISQAVAHEWWHALDNYLARGSTESLSYSGAYATSGLSWSMREELRNDLVWLMHLRSTAPDFVKRTANAPSNPKYWSEATERAARMFEQFVADKLAEKSEYDNLLTESPEHYSKDNMYLTDEEKKNVFPYFDKLFKDLKTEQTESGKTRLFQKDKEKIAGWFDVIDNKYVIGLTDNWNATTFSHEVMHMYSRVLQDNYNKGILSSYWKAQVEKLFDSVDARPQVDPADPTVVRYFLTDNQNELLAERFTTYLVENEIKNPELNAIFAVLREAMRITYAESGRTKHQPDKKTKEAFSVIFGAYDVAVAEQQALGLLEIEKPEGVSQEAYDHYMSFLLESRAKATHDMIKTYYAVEKYKKTKGYAKEYDETYTANLQAVEQEPRFKIKALAKQLGTEDVVTLLQTYNNVNGNALLTEDDVMNALNDTTEATQVAEARTAEMMEAKIREEFKIEDGTTLVSKDMKNAAMAKAFLMEALMYEGKDWADFEAEYRDLLGSVDNEIQKMPLSKLQNSRRWNQLESLYALRYQGFASTGNREKMAMVRRSQAQVVLIQNKMFEMNNRVDRFLEKFPKKLRTAQPQGQNTMSAESWDLLQSLMEKYGFKITDRRRSADPFNVKLDNWLKNIEASQYCPISNIRYFMPETAKGHEGSFGSMTVRQFEVLEHMATAINSIASREYTLFTESEKARYDALAKLTAERLNEKGIKPYDQNDSWWRKHFGVLSNIVNPEPILKALFPEEVHRMIIRPFFSAAAAAETKFNEWSDKWNDMIKGLNMSNTKKQYSTGHVISYNNVVNLLLAMGTEHAYENWRMFLHLDEAQAETVIAEALAEQPKLAEFANKYWAMMAETTDIMNTSYRQRYNKLFVKKQPRAFKIGEYEFTGGYVPETKLVSELTDSDGWESILMGELSNEKLISDKPDGQDLQSIVDNTRSRLRLFARWGHVAPAFNNFVRFVQREDVGNAIGSRAQGYIKGWLRDYHTPAGDSAGLMHALMSATTTTVLGIRLPQALLQLSGVIPAMNVLGRGGIRYMASALGHTLANGRFHQVEMAKTGPSEYMKARYSDPVKTLFGVSKAEMQISTTIGKFQKLAMSMISYMDAIVSNATWEASYRMSIDNGLSEIEAIEKADQDVRLSQTDSMTVSRARVMKSDWARIITPFSTYIMGMQSVVRGKIAEKEYYGAFTFALSYIAISTFFEAMLKEMPYPWDEDDDKNYIEKVLLRWYNDTVSTAGSTLYPIANLGSYATETFAYATEKLIDPDEKTWISMYGAGSLAALNYAKQYPDAVKYGLIGIFNGDEDAQRKAVANFVGWFSAGGKRLVKDLMED